MTGGLDVPMRRTSTVSFHIRKLLFYGGWHSRSISYTLVACALSYLAPCDITGSLASLGLFLSLSLSLSHTHTYTHVTLRFGFSSLVFLSLSLCVASHLSYTPSFDQTLMRACLVIITFPTYTHSHMHVDVNVVVASRDSGCIYGSCERRGSVSSLWTCDVCRWLVACGDSGWGFQELNECARAEGFTARSLDGRHLKLVEG